MVVSYLFSHVQCCSITLYNISAALHGLQHAEPALRRLTASLCLCRNLCCSTELSKGTSRSGRSQLQGSLHICRHNVQMGLCRHAVELGSPRDYSAP